MLPKSFYAQHNWLKTDLKIGQANKVLEEKEKSPTKNKKKMIIANEEKSSKAGLKIPQLNKIINIASTKYNYLILIFPFLFLENPKDRK